jgi:hypothetical protein
METLLLPCGVQSECTVMLVLQSLCLSACFQEEGSFACGVTMNWRTDHHTLWFGQLCQQNMFLDHSFFMAQWITKVTWPCYENVLSQPERLTTRDVWFQQDGATVHFVDPVSVSEWGVTWKMDWSGLSSFISAIGMTRNKFWYLSMWQQKSWRKLYELIYKDYSCIQTYSILLQEIRYLVSKVKLSRYTPWSHMGGEEV